MYYKLSWVKFILNLAFIPDLTADDETTQQSNKEKVNITGSINLRDLGSKINAKKI